MTNLSESTALATSQIGPPPSARETKLSTIATAVDRGLGVVTAGPSRFRRYAARLTQPRFGPDSCGSGRPLTIEAQCNHGTIVRQLRGALAELGWTVANDRARDLVGCSSPNGRAVTFEVKTDTSSQSIYTGVGQLVLHARPRATGDRCVLVVPDDLAASTEAVLDAEGILVLRYRWVDDRRIAFDGLRGVTGRLARSR